MATIEPQRLEDVARRMLAAAGAPDDIAACAARSLVESNLKGVDSHGVMQLPWYLDEIAKGNVTPAGRPVVENDTAGTALVRGNGGMGIYVLRHATDVAIAKARESHAASVGVIDCSHTGRIGWFAEAVAEAGMLGIVFGGGPHRIWSTAAPFGGAKPFFCTNPYAFGMPGGRFGPVVIDFATSTVADGKIAVYRAEGKRLPEGWIVDKNGNPTTDPEDFFNGGMHLPAAGHKGYGMALFAELMADAMLAHRHEYNWLVTVVDIGVFRAAADYAASAEELLQKVKDVPPAAGFDEVLLPGEPEARRAAARAASGVPIPDGVWTEIKEAAATVGVAVE